MIAGDKTANAICGKTARACESCLKRRARWYCPADDAFLCGGCDASVHSANQLARRHDRVRLGTSTNLSTSHKPTGCSSPGPGSATTITNTKGDSSSVLTPAWHGGFTRKARTPRKKLHGSGADGTVLKIPSHADLVPDLSGEFAVSAGSLDDSDDIGFQCRVPVFDPFGDVGDCEFVGAGLGGQGDGSVTCGNLDIGLLLPSEAELEEFAADVESLLGKDGIDDETGDKVKVKDELLGEDIMLELGGDDIIDVAGAWDVEAAMDWDSAFKLPMTESSGQQVGHDEKPVAMVSASEEEKNNKARSNHEAKPNKMLLQLNYEDVITAWESHGSPWANGARPDFRTDDGWPDFTNYKDMIGLRSIGCDDKGREARVSRYREKRRTRMFSKKIRYQVRKLNAEKRPRMKGRFVKRTLSSFT